MLWVQRSSVTGRWRCSGIRFESLSSPHDQWITLPVKGRVHPSRSHIENLGKLLKINVALKESQPQATLWVELRGSPFWRRRWRGRSLSTIKKTFLLRLGLSFDEPEHTDNDLSPEAPVIISNFMGAREETVMVSRSWTGLRPVDRAIVECPAAGHCVCVCVCVGHFYPHPSDSQMSPLSMRCKIEGIHERRSSWAIKRVIGEGDSSSGSQVVPGFNGVMLVWLFDVTCVEMWLLSHTC